MADLLGKMESSRVLVALQYNKCTLYNTLHYIILHCTLQCILYTTMYTVHYNVHCTLHCTLQITLAHVYRVHYVITKALTWGRGSTYRLPAPRSWPAAPGSHRSQWRREGTSAPADIILQVCAVFTILPTSDWEFLPSWMFSRAAAASWSPSCRAPPGSGCSLPGADTLCTLQCSVFSV